MYWPIAVDTALSIYGVRVFTAVWENLSGENTGPCSPLRFLEVQFPAGSSWVCMDTDILPSHHSPFSCLCLGGTMPHMMGICKVREDAEMGLDVRQNTDIVYSSFLNFLLLLLQFCCLLLFLFQNRAYRQSLVRSGESNNLYQSSPCYFLLLIILS